MALKESIIELNNVSSKVFSWCTAHPNTVEEMEFAVKYLETIITNLSGLPEYLKTEIKNKI